MAAKDTIRILADLNKAFPFADNDTERSVQEALGPDNQRFIGRAVKLLEEGDEFVKVAEQAGLTRDDVQKLQLQTGFFDLMTPEQFAVFVQKAAQIADTDGTTPGDELESLIKNSYYF